MQKSEKSILFFYGCIYSGHFPKCWQLRGFGTRNSVKMCGNGTFLKVYIIVNRLALWEELKYASTLDIIKSMLTTVPREHVEIVLPPANCFTTGHSLTCCCSAIDLGKEAANKRGKWHEMKWIEMNTHVLQWDFSFSEEVKPVTQLYDSYRVLGLHFTFSPTSHIFSSKMHTVLVWKCFIAYKS